MMKNAGKTAIHHIHQAGKQPHCDAKPDQPVPLQIAQPSALKNYQAKKAGDHKKYGHPPATRPLCEQLQPQLHLQNHLLRDAEITRPIRHLRDVID